MILSTFDILFLIKEVFVVFLRTTKKDEADGRRNPINSNLV